MFSEDVVGLVEEIGRILLGEFTIQLAVERAQ